MDTFFVDQSLLANGDGSYANPFNLVDGAAMLRDAEYLFTGRYNGSLKITAPVDSDQIIRIGSYGSDPCIFTSRIPITGVWTSVGGGIYSIALATTPYSFWAGYDGETVECGKDTTTPTTPAENKWGVSGTTLYWHPSTGYPSPGDTGATFEWNNGSLLHGIEINVGYVHLADVHGWGAAQHGLCLTGPALITGVLGTRVNATYNGSQGYSGTRIGNGIAVMFNTDGIEFYRCEASNNLDHGFNAEGLSGVAPRPKNVLFDWCDSHDNGSRGFAFGSNNSAYPCLDIDINRGSAHHNGNMRVAIPGTSLPGNYQCGVMHNKSRGKINRFHVHHNPGGGIVFFTAGFDGINGLSSSVTNCIIEDNNLLDNTVGPDYCGISMQNQYCLANGGAVGSVTVKNCLIINNKYRNFAQFYSPLTGSIRLVDNIIYGGTVRDIGIEGSLLSPGSIVAGNMFREGTSNYIGGNYATIDAINGTAWGAGNFVGVPSYADASGGDYRPTSDSVVVGAGYGADVSVDFDGQPRPNFEGHRSVGPHEYYDRSPSFGFWSPCGGTITPPVTSSNAIGEVRKEFALANPVTAAEIKQVLAFGA